MRLSRHEGAEPDAIQLPHYLSYKIGFVVKSISNYWSAETLSSRIQVITIADSSVFPTV